MPHKGILIFVRNKQDIFTEKISNIYIKDFLYCMKCKLNNVILLLGIFLQKENLNINVDINL